MEDAQGDERFRLVACFVATMSLQIQDGLCRFSMCRLLGFQEQTRSALAPVLSRQFALAGIS
jgi:hypothetical protein